MLTNSRFTLRPLLVLIVIAEAAHDDGSGAWPSIATIAKRARLSERTVQRLLPVLEAAGEVVVHRSGGRRSHRFTIPGLAPSAPQPIAQLRLPLGATVTSGSPTVTSGSHRNGDSHVSPQPSCEPTEPSSRARMVSRADTQAGA